MAAIETTTPRTFGYCRVSTLEQSSTGKSLLVQEAQLRGWAQMTGREIDHVVVEAGISGGTEFAKRPEGGKLLADLREGDTLVVGKLDRFSRNLFDCLAVSQELQRRGVDLFLLDVGSDAVTGNGQSKLFLSMLACFAEFERDRISERIKATKQRQKARGEFSGGIAKFGWCYDDQKKLVPDPAQQLVIKKIRRLSDRGLSPRQIARKLRETGDGMSHVTVRRIIRQRRWLYG